MHPAVVVPAAEFSKYAAKFPFIPDRDPIETLATKCPYQPLDMCSRVGCGIRGRHSTDPHFLPEPGIVCGSTGHSRSCTFHLKRMAELTKLAVVVVQQELGLLLEAGVPDLLLRPLERWIAGYVQADDLSTRKLHDHENAEHTKANRVLHKEVTAPHGLGLVFQKASAGLGICRSRPPFDHAPPDGRAGVAYAELYLQLQCNAILSVLRAVRGYPPNELDVFARNCRSARPTLRLPPPELPKFLFLYRITVSGLTRISSEVQSLQILDTDDQNSRSWFLNRGFFNLRL